MDKNPYAMRIHHQHISIARALACLAVLWLCGSAYAAEVRYVTDQLSLNMYKDTSLSERMPALKSGDRVTLVKFDDGYAQVKTEDGKLGWVKSSYLVEEPPASVRIVSLQDELDELRSKHADLLIDKTRPQAPVDDTLKKRLQSAEKARERLEQRLAELESERTAHISQIQKLSSRPEADTGEEPKRQLLLWVVLPVLTLLTGFFLGLKYLEAKVRAKFGGFNPL